MKKCRHFRQTPAHMVSKAARFPVVDCLPATDREWLGKCIGCVLQSAERISEVVVSYTDPILKNSKVERAGFTTELVKRNMVGFRSVSDIKLGNIFVSKRFMQLRLMFGTR